MNTEMNDKPIVKKERKPSAWIVHVKAYRLKHPKLSYKECLINAAKTYKKVKPKVKVKAKAKKPVVKPKEKVEKTIK